MLDIGAMEAKDVITSIAALVGMALGIYNFFHARLSDRVRLLVIPKSASFQGVNAEGRPFYRYNKNGYDLDHPSAKPDTLAIEVVNKSKFAVTVNEVGLRYRWKEERLVLVTPIIHDGKPWPRKLEPRDSVTVYFDIMSLLQEPLLPRVNRAYASTICRETCLGRSGALREFVRIARNLS